MIGDRGISIAALNTGLRDVLHRRGAVAPFGVHLEVAQVLLKGRTRERGIREHSADVRTAEKIAPTLGARVYVRAPAAGFYGLFNGRRSAGLQPSRITRAEPGPI